MAGAQNKKDTPGAFKSCLIPYTEQILNWWYDERLYATKIQQRLLPEFDIEVHRTTLSRFIKVRHLRPDPHRRPAYLHNNVSEQIPAVQSKTSQKQPKSEKKVALENTKNALKNSQKEMQSSAPKAAAPISVPISTIDPKTATAEEIIQYLGTSTPQELGRVADKAKAEELKAKRK